MTTRYLDYIVVVDLEALCWDDRFDVSNQCRSFPEIIEIGACKLSVETAEPFDKRRYLIKPKYGRVSEFCTELTTITQEQLDKEGIPFGDAVNKFKKDFQPQNRQWASWGEYDKVVFRQQCQFFQNQYPFSDIHTNIKDEFGKIMKWKKGRGVKFVCDLLGIPFEGTQHRGDDDAWNTAKILGAMIGMQRIGYQMGYEPLNMKVVVK